VLEEHAAGFADQLFDEAVQRPSDLEASDADANPHSGAVNGGTSELYQQRIVRLMPAFGRAETPVENLYLVSAAATPGGGESTACAGATPRGRPSPASARGWPRRRLNRTVLSLTIGDPIKGARRGLVAIR
jgi:phytoene dehydrogenase-like protein